MKRVLTKMVAALAAPVLFASTILAADSASEPHPESASGLRYKFEPGQEIVYESTDDFKHDRGTHHTQCTTTLWVAGVNPDGGWHVVARYESAFTQTFGESGPKNPEPEKEERMGTFDLLPTGRINNLPEGYPNDPLRGPLFELPKDLATARMGWEDARDPDAKKIYRLWPGSNPSEGKWIFSEAQEGLFNTIYLSTSEQTIHFDAGSGSITGCERVYSQGYGFHGKGTTKLELKSVSTKPKEWIAQLAEEASILVRARKEMTEMGEKSGNKIANVQDAATKLFEEARARVKLPIVQAQLDEDLRQMKEYVKYDAENQAKDEAVMNKPSPDWETTDLGGNKQRLADYRGKVVLLDFWYRGCGWCIKAMPQIKEVADHYRDQPVAVLGMNTDREAKDAQFVVDKLQLNYPTLKAAGLPEKYAVQGFPTLIIIDADGVVRARHVGYSATLRDELIKTVDGLIPGKK